jgi:hypothetical protein
MSDMDGLTHRAHPGWRALLVGALLAGIATSPAFAFDMAGFRSRLDASVAEVKAKSLSDPKTTMARLDEMIALGKVGAKEYGEHAPKFAKLMDAVVADAEAMRGLTDEEIEAKWGEDGNAGDAVGVPLKSLGQFDETRAHMELVIGPAHAYIFLKKYAANHKAALLDKAADELAELAEHLKQVH